MPARIPRISTRGYYDLATGRTLKKKSYDLYPKRFFENLGSYPEFTIVVHGMRNNKQGALEKFKIAQKRLRQLGYKHPVIGFSYDSNVKGAQYKLCEFQSTKIGRLIAKKNGTNLAKFITNSKRQNPYVKIRLLGHSLGSEIIIFMLYYLVKKNLTVEQVYFFGASIPMDLFTSAKASNLIQKTVVKRLTNYYNPNDDILMHAHERGIIKNPIGYCGMMSKFISKYLQKRIHSKNHRFKSYIDILNKYP